jgi:hypothetical protein
MRTWADIERDKLAAEFPDHQVWYVPRYCATTVWCARRAGEPCATVNAESPEELVKAIGCAESRDCPSDDTSAVNTLPTRNDCLTITAVGSASDASPRLVVFDRVAGVDGDGLASWSPAPVWRRAVARLALDSRLGQ